MTSLTRRRAIGLAAAAASSACYSPLYAQSTNKPKVAFTLLFPPGGDYGWDYEHMRGIQQARDFYGDRVQIDTFHEVAEWGNGDKEKFQELVDDGYNLIFTTSAGYMRSAVEIAQQNPQVMFECFDSYIRSANIATFNTRWYEGRYVEGFLAGSVSKTNRVGYLGAYPIPQVIRGINAAYLGAKSANPDIEFEIVWLNTWFDPQAERTTALELNRRGADVLMQHTVTTAAVEVAQENGIYSFGQGSDMSKWGPDAVMTSMVNNWGPYYTRRIGEFLDGNWKSEENWLGLGQEMVALSPLLETLPSRTVLQTQDLIARISSGEQHPFVGPLRKQDGSGWLAPGETASESDLLTMDYYVDGIASVYPTES
ncbi:BMP family ABC transporter substrate-binding protein [Loktanella agnita]|uniref:BMP family ABC transporter substrate-binding protein n=1 Tax=Loktanella agnita TaxID=287097 RepID=UPI0039856D35